MKELLAIFIAMILFSSTALAINNKEVWILEYKPPSKIIIDDTKPVVPTSTTTPIGTNTPKPTKPGGATVDPNAYSLINRNVNFLAGLDCENYARISVSDCEDVKKYLLTYAEKYLPSKCKSQGVDERKMALVNYYILSRESDFYRYAANPESSARGMCQVLKGTAKELGIYDPFDPQQCIAGMSKYIGGFLGKYGCSLEYAVAAYKWGPGNVDDSGGNFNSDTRSYLAEVMPNYQNTLERYA